MHRREATYLLITASSLAWLLAAQPALAQGAFGGAADRGNAAEQLLDKTKDDAVIDELKKQSKKAQEEEKLNVDEAEKELNTGNTARNSTILDNLPTQERLQRIEARIQAEPNNLDHYFEYAQVATAMQEFDKAARAYEQMLAKDPNLDRVRLDLGVTYMRLGKFEEAKHSLETVLKRNPPEQVQANIQSIMAQLDKELATYDLNGYVSTGVHYDSNANSAPAENAIVIFDTNIPLGPDQRAQDDYQFFAASGLNHTYKPKWAKGDDVWGTWNSSISAYMAEQSSQENLDLKVLSLKTGPEFNFYKAGLKLRPEIGYSHITLAGETYLKTLNAEGSADYDLTNRIRLSAGTKHEWREFENAPNVSTYADRTGSATQVSGGAQFILDNEHFLNANVTARKERTRREYYDNSQLGGSIALTKLLPYDMFVNGQIGYRSTLYDGADALISNKRRHDKERSSGITLGRKFSEDVTATIGYQYRDVNSNIINYKYDNHRFSGALNIRF